jgi:hypothetical protein
MRTVQFPAVVRSNVLPQIVPLPLKASRGPPLAVNSPCASFFGFSATIARPATEAASCRAVRTTFVGSMMLIATRGRCVGPPARRGPSL